MAEVVAAAEFNPGSDAKKRPDHAPLGVVFSSCWHWGCGAAGVVKAG
jgi:hypothetical protein